MQDCAFSNGGHLFAATTGNAVNVYDYYTFECLAQLRGHNQKVLRVAFDKDERTLVSAGMDGSVIRWDILEGKRILMKTMVMSKVGTFQELLS